MGAISEVKVQVFRSGSYNNFQVEGCNPIPFQGLSCDYKSLGEMWMVPQVVNGAVDHYDETYEDASAYTDAFKVVRLRNNHHSNDIVYILGTEQQWMDSCNGCCGDTPSMDSVTIPDPLLAEPVCCETTVTESDCVYSSYDTTGTIIAGQEITITGVDQDGAAFTPAAPDDGFTTRNAMLTWVQANWGAYGTWTAVGDDGIKLASSTVKKGGFTITLLADEPYCLTITVGDKFDTVTDDGVAVALPAEVTVVSATQVIAAIKDYFSDCTQTAVSSTKIQYVGSGVPGGYSGTNTRTFVAGACS